MPRSPRRICRVKGCGQLTDHGATHCDEHLQHANQSNWAKWENKHGNRHQRGYGSRWVKLRAKVLKRDSHLCKRCLRNGRVTEGNHVDHIIPKVAGGGDEMSNLQTLCEPCHNAKTQEDRKLYGGAGKKSG